MGRVVAAFMRCNFDLSWEADGMFKRMQNNDNDDDDNTGEKKNQAGIIVSISLK